MVQFNQVMPALKTNDLQDTIGFYTDHLGFTLCWRSSLNGRGETCMLDAGKASILFSTGAHLGDSPLLSGTLDFNIDGVDAYYEQVKGRVEIVWPLEVMSYGTREFGIRDDKGYTLAFAEEVDEAKGAGH